MKPECQKIYLYKFTETGISKNLKKWECTAKKQQPLLKMIKQIAVFTLKKHLPTYKFHPFPAVLSNNSDDQKLFKENE